MKRFVWLLLAALFVCVPAAAQTRKVQNRPYLDQRRLHYGFLFGFQIQDLELRNNGYIDPATGQQWYADIDNYNPGFSVGVLGELRLSTHLALRVSPTMHFGQKHALFHEQTSGRDSTQNLKSSIISVPVDLKMAAPRYNNFRPYFIAGVCPQVDLTTHKHRALMMKPFDLCLEVGMGCDIYLPYFKLIPELKFSFGLADILQKKRTDLIDGTLMKFTNGLDSAHSKMIVLTLYFE
ncbi:MAG: PorT family protein [Bacteroidaceae bacterium]|nr:PorT family protein [Bacteroidaceae bacterium]